MTIVASDDQTKKTIARNLNRILRERGLSRYWLAQETGEYQATIGRVCNASNCCSSGLLARIAEALKISTDALIFPDRKNYPKAG